MIREPPDITIIRLPVPVSIEARAWAPDPLVNAQNGDGVRVVQATADRLRQQRVAVGVEGDLADGALAFRGSGELPWLGLQPQVRVVDRAVGRHGEAGRVPHIGTLDDAAHKLALAVVLADRRRQEDARQVPVAIGRCHQAEGRLHVWVLDEDRLVQRHAFALIGARREGWREAQHMARRHRLRHVDVAVFVDGDGAGDVDLSVQNTERLVVRGEVDDELALVRVEAAGADVGDEEAVFAIEAAAEGLHLLRLARRLRLPDLPYERSLPRGDAPALP